MPRFKSLGNEPTFEIPSDFVPFEVIPNPTLRVSKIERHAKDSRCRVQSRIWICEDISHPMRDFLLLCLKFVGHYNSSFSTGTYAVAKVAN